MAGTAKITISLPKELISLADRLAEEKKISRSKVVSECLSRFARQEWQARMEQGYLAMAEEHQEFAELTAEVASESLPDWEN